MAKQEPMIPLYVFTGFLDAGKTRFISETLADARFNTGERTLLLLCEEGEEEYDPSAFPCDNVFIEPIESEDEINPVTLEALRVKHRAQRVLVEYNGMWLLDTLFNSLPEKWQVYQEFMFADARSFVSYNANMRQLVYDKLKTCELVVFNRFGPGCDQLALHKIVRAVSRRADIAYETEDGAVSYDEIEDPLPFDVDAPVVDIEDRDYALFYQDLSSDIRKYDGKTLRYKAMVVTSDRLQGDCFIFGRQLMTCCVNDIQFTGLICRWPRAAELKKGEWAVITAKAEVRFHKGYGRKGPVLTVLSLEKTQPPEQPVATFY